MLFEYHVAIDYVFFQILLQRINKQVYLDIINSIYISLVILAILVDKLTITKLALQIHLLLKLIDHMFLLFINPL